MDAILKRADELDALTRKFQEELEALPRKYTDEKWKLVSQYIDDKELRCKQSAKDISQLIPPTITLANGTRCKLWRIDISTRGLLLHVYYITNVFVIIDDSNTNEIASAIAHLKSIHDNESAISELESELSAFEFFADELS